MKHYYYFWVSPLGKLFLFANENSLKAIIFNQPEEKANIRDLINSLHGVEKKNPVITEAISELTAYFKGRLTEFRVRLDPEGTDFQKKAWSVLRKIPYGEVISYGEQAKRLKKPEALRAVGQANGKNPIPIIIPCHRVIAKDKSIGGYSGGIDIKKKLLGIENSMSQIVGKST
jgi:methylated-DNA-[protein]-cysteine S-methyltransferase